jgi:2-polyprenyl-6-methoxyphenol hydroxylase-like FAD-dependent oxidoreductase
MALPLGPVQGRSAIVIGGGIAGLVAAHVLAQHFEAVTLVERDVLDGSAPRTGVPQARHQHLLLAGGAIALEGLFPGLHDELFAAGAHLLDVGADIGWLTPVGWAPRVRSGLTVPACSRELLEAHLRRRVAGIPSVLFLDGQEVHGLVASGDRGAIAGVQLRARAERGPSAVERVMSADLVVDASGRGSHAPRWLTQLGYPTPRETVVNARLGYASRLYRGQAELPAGLKGAIVRSAPPACQRGGVVMPIENGHTLVTLVGLGGDYPPTDETGFTAFARSLRDPLLAEAVKDAEPLPGIAGSRATQNRVRHYERPGALPEGLVVLGDAACAFNPVFQQGMAVAVLGALTLERCLREPDRGDLSRRFQRSLSALQATPWMLATAADLRVSGVVGSQPSLRRRLCQHYLRHVAQRASEDARVRRSYLEVLNLVQPARALLRPGVVGSVVAGASRRALRAQRAPGVLRHPRQTPSGQELLASCATRTPDLTGSGVTHAAADSEMIAVSGP